MAEADCEACHNAPSDTDAFATTAEDGELCSDCHDSADLTTGEMAHEPFEDGACLDCHDPHSSDQVTLLLEPGSQLCFSCHDDTSTNAAVAHDPLASEDGCLSCHAPHATGHPKLLDAAVGELCFSCHEEVEREAQQLAELHDPTDPTFRASSETDRISSATPVTWSSRTNFSSPSRIRRFSGAIAPPAIAVTVPQKAVSSRPPARRSASNVTKS
jgi:predicted CXXCH cytochrome family protein